MFRRMGGEECVFPLCVSPPLLPNCCLVDQLHSVQHLCFWRLNTLAVSTLQPWIFVAVDDEIHVFSRPHSNDESPKRLFGLSNLPDDCGLINQIRCRVVGENMNEEFLVCVAEPNYILVYLVSKIPDCSPIVFTDSDSPWSVSIHGSSQVVCYGSNAHHVTVRSMQNEEGQESSRIIDDHTHNVPCVDISPCGKYVASVSIDDYLRIHRVCDGKMVRIHNLENWGWGVRWMRRADAIQVNDAKRCAEKWFKEEIHTRTEPQWVCREFWEGDPDDLERLDISTTDSPDASVHFALNVTDCLVSAFNTEQECDEYSQDLSQLLLVISTRSTLRVILPEKPNVECPFHCSVTSNEDFDPQFFPLHRFSLIETLPSLSSICVGSQGMNYVFILRVIVSSSTDHQYAAVLPVTSLSLNDGGDPEFPVKCLSGLSVRDISGSDDCHPLYEIMAISSRGAVEMRCIYLSSKDDLLDPLVV